MMATVKGTEDRVARVLTSALANIARWKRAIYP